jgi:glycosyltransferase involved in cell wall biosynthesis
MRVVHIVDTLNVGGAQSLLATLAETMPDGVELTVISLRSLPENGIVARLRAEGVRLFALPARHLVSPVRFWKLWQTLRQGGYDMVHTHLTYANILGIAAARLARRPVLGTLHNVRASHQAGLQRRLEGLALRRGANQIVAVGQEVAHAYKRRWRELEIKVLPNAVALPEPLATTTRLALRGELLQSRRGPLLVAVGRLTPQKGYPDLLTAFKDVLQQWPEARLVIVGDGELHADLEDQCRQLGLNGSVELAGLRSDVPRVLAAADVFVSASHWEGMPVALLEAMAAGLPVVVTAVGDVPNVVDEETGVLVPAQDPHTLATAVNTLLADPERRTHLGAAARARISAQYSATAWTEQLLDLYHRLAEAM